MDKNDFINKVVLGWMKNDLLRMISIRPSESEIGNINFPLALCVLSYIEYLGGFLFGTDKKFLKNVKKYIDECFINPDEYYPIEVLKDLVRNGLAHEYFPRGAISRNGKHPAIYKGKSFELVLDAETLVNDFIDSLENFVKKLEDEKYEARMKEAIDNINEFKDEHKDFLSKLTGQPDDEGDSVTPSNGIPENSGESGCSGASINTTTLPPSSWRK